MSILSILNAGTPADAATLVRLRQRLHAGGLMAAGAQEVNVPDVVGKILTEVRTGGDSAAAALASRLDRAQLTPDSLRVTAEQLETAHSQCDAEFLELVRETAANIRAYQEHIKIQAPPPMLRAGRRLGVRYTPLDRAAVYVPGGQALYPSTVLMTVVPALVAGVKEVIMLSPATGGQIHPVALALAQELGLKEVYRLGGAVGIAAAAYGTESIRPVNKIVGPGNAFVAEAKRQVSGTVGIDAIAGPSEVLIVADESANPEWLAADMLAQAEHNPGSALLVTTCAQTASNVAAAVETQLKKLERADITEPSLRDNSAIVIAASADQACDIANDFATEHLQVIVAQPDRYLEKLRHGGAIFIGAETPVPLGDYIAGPSHVLPTGGTAKFSGPLSCNDFLKSSSIIEYDAASMAEDAGKVSAFATREGLTAHARAATIRLAASKGSHAAGT